eukprot:m.150749 g.150749  ORF g.150749 m.150749 type:complete len:337 (-) comp17830_c0_seq18:66-1076(-)
MESSQNLQGSTVEVNFDTLIHAIAFSNHPTSASLLAVGGDSKVIVTELIGSGPTSESTSSLLSLEHFHHGTRVAAIAWSPRTIRASDAVAKIVFATAGGDYKIRIFTSVLDGSNPTVSVLEGHTDNITSLGFDNLDGRWLASTGDDGTVRVWDVDAATQHTCTLLASPGAAVMWHPRDAMRELSEDTAYEFMVAERGGTIKFMEVGRTQPIRSIFTTHSPLLDAHWSAVSPDLIGAVANGQWVTWKRQDSSVAAAIVAVNMESPTCIQWSASLSDRVAIGGLNRWQILCSDGEREPNGSVVVAEGEGHCTAVSWSIAEPTCCVAVGSTLQLVNAEN